MYICVYTYINDSIIVFVTINHITSIRTPWRGKTLRQAAQRVPVADRLPNNM